MEPQQPNKVPYENNIFASVLKPKAFQPTATFDQSTTTKGFFDDVIEPKKTPAQKVTKIVTPIKTSGAGPQGMDVTEVIGKVPAGMKTAQSSPDIAAPGTPNIDPFAAINKIFPGIKKTFQTFDQTSLSDFSPTNIWRSLGGYKKDEQGNYTIKMTPEESKTQMATNLKQAQDLVMGFTTGEGSIAKEVETAAAKFGSDALGKTRAILDAGKKLVENPTLKERVVNFFKGAIDDFYDSSHSINKFMNQAEKEIGRPLSVDENAYVAARLYKGVGGKIEATLNNFGSILKGAGEDATNGNLSNYLFAERSAERADRGFANPGGLTGEEAKNAVTQLAAEVGPERFATIQNAAKQVYSYADNLLNMLHDSGIIGKDSYDAIKANNQKYTPFDILEHMIRKDEGNMIPSGSKAFSVASQDVVKSIKGAKETDLIDDPLNSFVRKTMKTIDLVERNNVVRKLADVAKTSKLGATLAKDDVLPKGYDTLSYFENGTKKQIAVPQDVADSMKRLSSKQADLVTRGMSFWSKALRAGATSLNMAFIVPNALRDFETATLVNKDGFNVADWGKGFFEGVKGSLADLGFNVDDSVYQNYLKSAGEIGGYYSTYLHDIPKTVEDLTKPMYKQLLGLLNPVKLIEEVGSVIERAPRLGVFMKTLSKTGSPTAAGFASREATVDFAKMGNVTKIFNMWVPFVNARLQGEVNIAKSLMRDAQNPKTAAWAAAKIGSMAVAPFLASYYSNIHNFPQVWNDIANYEKANNIILIYGDHKDESGRYDQILKIPKGDWNYFIDPIQDFLEWSSGEQPSLFKALGTNTLMDFVPLSTSPQDTVGGTIEQGILGLQPSIMKAITEDAFNMNSYRMTPIVPQSMEKADPKEQYKPYTPLIAVKLGQALNMSPLKIENAIETLFAGVGRQVMSLAGTAEKPGFTPPTQFTGQRFFSAAGGAQTKKIDDELVKEQSAQATRQVIEKRQAQQAFNAIVTASSPEEAQKIIDDLKTNSRVQKQVITLIDEASKGTTFQDKQIKALSPIERAQYIYDKIKTAPTQKDAEAFLNEVQTQGFMSEETAAEFNNLINPQQ